MRNLSKAVLALVMLAFVSVNAAQAQDFTDQDMKDYAVILMAQKSITDKISPMVNELIEKQDGIDGNRFAELDKVAKGKVDKLPADATDFEKQFYGLVQKQVSKKKKAVSTVVGQLATHSLGKAKYNAIKKAYKGGGDVKSKIDGIISAMSAQP